MHARMLVIVFALTAPTGVYCLSTGQRFQSIVHQLRFEKERRTLPMMERPTVHRRACIPIACEQPEKRLFERTDVPALFFWDDWWDTPTERAARQREAEANIEKWGKILSAKDTFDETIVPESATKPEPEVSIAGLAPEVVVIAGSTVLFVAMAAATLL